MKSIFIYLACIPIICIGIPLNAQTKTSAARQVINFNQDWKFTRVDTEKKELDSKLKLPNTGWTITSVSSVEPNENNKAEAIIDNNAETYWISEYKNQKINYPHSIVIDLGKVCDIKGFSYVGRQNTSRGWIKDFELYASLNTTDFGSPVINSAFSSNNNLQVFAFSKTINARYIKLVAINAHNKDQCYAAISEIGFVKGDKSIDLSSWHTQFEVVHVQSDGTAITPPTSKNSISEELERLKTNTWETVSLPHTGYIEPLIITNEWEGLCYYQKTFSINPKLKGKRIELNFGAAMQTADIWLNGKHITKHTGGYLPFSIDLTDKVHYKKPNTIFVKLDNKANPDVPPGKPLKGLDFAYYSGLYRDVELVAYNPIHITNPIAANKVAGGGIFVTYDKVSTQSATVKIQTHIINEGVTTQAVKAVQTLIDQSGNIVGSTESIDTDLEATNNIHLNQELNVNNPLLWSPDAPNLYTLRTQIFAGDQVVDTQETRIGIRWFEFTATGGCLVNGKQVIWMGTNRHQEYPYIGNALSKNAQYRDILKIKNAGFNSVRLSHYPQDPSVLDACDELGLLVENPIAGWQFYNDSEAFREHVFKDIREYIRRDRNHPSVALWEVSLNESFPPAEFCNKSVAIAHEEMPGLQCFTSGDTYNYKPSDGLTWDVPHSTFLETDNAIYRNLTAQFNRPHFAREYGDYEFGGGKSTSRVNRFDGEAKLLQSAWNFLWEYNYIRSTGPDCIGGATWLMYDANRGGALNLCRSGTSEITRIPKFSYYFFKSQRNPNITYSNPDIETGPMVFIANYWTKRDATGNKVVVFSNADEVELVLNGKSIKKQKPDSGKDTPYGPLREGGNPFDGGNCTNLAHAPFTFVDVPYEAGELKAIAYINGQNVSTHSVRTPETPTELSIKVDYSNRPLKADGSDAVFVYVSLVDKNGTLCIDAINKIKCEISGQAKLVSPAEIDTEAGIATFLIQATNKAGKINLAFSANGINGKSIEMVGF